MQKVQAYGSSTSIGGAFVSFLPSTFFKRHFDHQTATRLVQLPSRNETIDIPTLQNSCRYRQLLMRSCQRQRSARRITLRAIKRSLKSIRAQTKKSDPGQQTPLPRPRKSIAWTPARVPWKSTRAQAGLNGSGLDRYKPLSDRRVYGKHADAWK